MLLVDCRIKSTKSIAVIDDFDANSYTLIRLKQNIEKDCTSS
ncbi:hypothetical protein CRENPOLYSF2_2390008 [Crenothrix polyspora]|uniref:Uncharacterized protein n=1 Tax=Crenothrix polyspora TaxID=360316 RepID=A0A1R4H6G9_9GAMM|nr:hypothetical protein CRENPOLYSF2_2390008 [Crenothrix polyspora]